MAKNELILCISQVYYKFPNTGGIRVSHIDTKHHKLIIYNKNLTHPKKSFQYICDIWCVYIDLAGLLILVLLWVLFTTCHFGSLGDPCRMGGKCVCRHLTSAWVASSLRGAGLIEIYL